MAEVSRLAIRCAGGWAFYTVIAVSSEDDENAYPALTPLKELDSQHQVGSRRP